MLIFISEPLIEIIIYLKLVSLAKDIDKNIM